MDGGWTMNAWLMSTVNISDERLDRRMRKILDRVESKPGVGLPAACKGWDVTNGAYHCYIQIGGIVQGLLHSPKLIILDEPTSGLDPLMQQKFFNLIAEENKKGATVFFSSHILSEVQQLCDRVAIIKDGEIVSIEDVKSLPTHKGHGKNKIHRDDAGFLFTGFI